MSNFTQEAVKQLSQALNEPAWMLQFRLDAFAIYENTPLPTTKDEPWRRTNLRRLNMDKMTPSLNGNGAVTSQPTEFFAPLDENPLAGSLQIVDGVTTQYTITDTLKEQGVVFCDMSTAVQEHPELIKTHFMSKIVKPEDGKFAALHAAFWRGGTFLYVPKDVEVKEPFRTTLWSDKGFTFSHTLVVLAEHAKATLIDEYSSQDGNTATLHNGAIELSVGVGAHLIYASLQDFANNLWQFTHEKAVVQQDGKLDWVVSVMGSRLTKAFQTVDLDGRGSFARVSGLFFGDGRQHFDLDTQQNHNAPDTASDLLYKGALKDKARSVWQGLIKALPKAQRIDGFQANRNLLLSDSARADSIPGLEIEADDVRCTHAATAGQLDPNEIFYLMSRGIEREIAVQMVVEGFFIPVLDRVELPGIAERITKRILSKVQ